VTPGGLAIMGNHVRILIVLGLVAGLPAGAAADDATIIGSLSGVAVRSPDQDGQLRDFGQGLGAGIHMLCGCDDATLGWEMQALFLGNDAGQRLYDLRLTMLVGPALDDRPVMPFIDLGLDRAAVRLGEGGSGRNVGLGVHGGVGVHGFLGEALYWRGAVGFIGAGVGGLEGQLMVGYVFGRE
jgi:hypothetical protein